MTDVRVAQWRTDTPGCAERVHWNNAGAGLMPRQVGSAIKDHIDLELRLGGYEAADATAAAVARCYESVASLIGCKPGNVAIVANATAGFVQALSSFDLGSGDIIVTSKSDYTSNQIQYVALAKRLGVRIVHAQDLPEGGIDPASVASLLQRGGVKLVCLSWIPTHSGLVQDAAAVGSVCKEYGVPFVLDACQAVGQLPIDVASLHCDYLSATARKFLRGPRGIGFMYASDAALARGDYPLFIDMRGATWTAPGEFDVHAGARRYEDWEFPYALVHGLTAAVDYALGVGIETAHERAFGLARALRARLAQLEGVRVLDRGSDPCAIVTAEIGSLDARNLVRSLFERGINTTATLQWFGLLDLGPRAVTTALRMSPHYYNTEDEMEALLDALSSMLMSVTPSA